MKNVNVRVRSGLQKDNHLLEKIKVLDAASTTKTAIRQRALRVEKPEGWVQKAYTLVGSLPRADGSAEDSGQYQVPLEGERDEELLTQAYDEIRRQLKLSRVNSALTFRLLLANLLLTLESVQGKPSGGPAPEPDKQAAEAAASKQQKVKAVQDCAEAMIEIGVDSLVFKMAYQDALLDPQYSRRELEYLNCLCRSQLEKQPLLYAKLRAHANRQIRSYSDYLNVAQYFPPKGPCFATANIVYLSKVLAGIYISEIEMQDIQLIDLLRELEPQFWGGNDSPIQP